VSDGNLSGRAIRRARLIRSRLASRYFVNLGSADPDIIFIAGTGRSGTTWLTELLARSTRRRVIFEPFRNDRVPEWGDARRRQYIRPDDRASAFLEPARRILDPDFRNEWADSYNGRFFTRGRLVKDIRANLMLRWLYEQLGPFPIIFLIRNPGAVASSWSRAGWTFSPADDFLCQNALVQDYLSALRDEIASARGVLDRAVYTWAVETYVALSQFRPSEILVVFYEQLLLNPSVEFARIEAYLEGKLARLVNSSPDRPSATAAPEVAHRSQKDRLNAWQEVLTEQEADRVYRIVSLFELGYLYSREGLPLLDADQLPNPAALS
jgi:Sulfotransferase family